MENFRKTLQLLLCLFTFTISIQKASAHTFENVVQPLQLLGEITQEVSKKPYLLTYSVPRASRGGTEVNLKMLEIVSPRSATATKIAILNLDSETQRNLIRLTGDRSDLSGDELNQLLVPLREIPMIDVVTTLPSDVEASLIHLSTVEEQAEVAYLWVSAFRMALSPYLYRLTGNSFKLRARNPFPGFIDIRKLYSTIEVLSYWVENLPRPFQRKRRYLALGDDQSHSITTEMKELTGMMHTISLLGMNAQAGRHLSEALEFHPDPRVARHIHAPFQANSFIQISDSVLREILAMAPALLPYHLILRKRTWAQTSPGIFESKTLRTKAGLYIAIDLSDPSLPKFFIHYSTSDESALAKTIRNLHRVEEQTQTTFPFFYISAVSLEHVQLMGELPAQMRFLRLFLNLYHL